MSSATLGGLREDAWLAERLGKPAFTVDGDLPERFPAGFFQARVPVADFERLAELSAAEFRVIEVSQQLERPAAPLEAHDVPVAPVRDDQGDAVLAIAEASFEFDRFHADPAIPDAVADRIKRDWVGSYLARTRGDCLWVAEVDGAPAGFLAELRASDGVAVIDLIAVAREFRGRGVARALVAALADRPLRVGTQAANAPSRRLYAGLGFEMRSAATVMHRHVEERS